MKKGFIALLCSCFCLCAAAQSGKPDFKAIEKSINDKASPFYYPVLLKRYQDGDTTLALADYRHLYYGFTFMPEYSPYGRASQKDKIRELVSKKELSTGEIDQVIELEKQVLKEFPFNLGDLNTLVTMYDKKKDSANGTKAFKKLVGIGKAMISSGNGFADSTAMYVISVDHEYDMIWLLGYKFGGGQSLQTYKGESVDQLKLADNDDGIKAMYFNVDRLFAALKKQFEVKE